MKASLEVQEGDPRAHFYVMHCSNEEKPTSKTNIFSCTAFKKQPPPPLLFFQQTWAEVVDIAQTQSQERELAVGEWGGGGVGGLSSLFLKSTGLYGSPPLFAGIFSEAHLFFLRQTGAHPRKLLRAATCSDTAFFPHYDLPLNSFTPADHHAAKRRSSHKTAPKKKTRKKTKEGKLGGDKC